MPTLMQGPLVLPQATRVTQHTFVVKVFDVADLATAAASVESDLGCSLKTDGRCLK